VRNPIPAFLTIALGLILFWAGAASAKGPMTDVALRADVIAATGIVLIAMGILRFNRE
jgi:hypothetical protein